MLDWGTLETHSKLGGTAPSTHARYLRHATSPARLTLSECVSMIVADAKPCLRGYQRLRQIRLKLINKHGGSPTNQQFHDLVSACHPRLVLPVLRVPHETVDETVSRAWGNTAGLGTSEFCFQRMRIVAFSGFRKCHGGALESRVGCSRSLSSLQANLSALRYGYSKR
jgi:hypothetical protein